MQRVLSDAADGGQESADALAKVGVTAADLKSARLDEQFAMIADGIQGIADPADKAAAAMAVMGKSGTRMLPMLKDGAAGLRQLLGEVKEVGAVVSGEDANNATRIGDALDRAWTSVKNTIRSVAASFLDFAPDIEDLAKSVMTVTQGIRDFVRENKELIVTVATVAAGVIAAGAALVGIGSAAAVASFALGGLVANGTAIGGLISTLWAWAPVIAIVAGVAAAIGGLAYALYEFTPIGDAIRSVMGQLGEVLGWLGDVAGTSWQGIKAAFSVGNWSGIKDVALATLDVLWSGLKVGGQRAWAEFKSYTVDTWNDVVTLAQKALVDVAAELQLIGADWKSYFSDLWTNVWNGFIDAAGAAFDVGKLMLNRWIDNVVEAVKAIPDLVSGAIDSVEAVVTAKSPAEMAKEHIAAGAKLADQGGVQSAQDIIRAHRDQLKADLDATRATEQFLAEMSRAADIAAARNELSEAELKLQQVVAKQIEDAQIAANTALFAAEVAEWGRANVGGIQKAMSALPSSSRGTFSGTGAYMELSAGNVLSDIRKNTAETAEGVKKFQAERFAE